ncbi:MAG: fasciclin domain-containing protein [Planctomycetota bacterium]
MLIPTLRTALLATLTAATTMAGTNPGQHDIVDTALAAGQFNTLAKALTAAELVDVLKGDGPFTVFAPTDDAFGDIPSKTLRTLLRRDQDALGNILTYHVVAGSLTAKDLLQLSQVTTVNGQRLDLRAGDNGLTVDGAGVVKADIACSNGIIHVIDRVLMPQAGTIPQVAAQAGSFGTLVQAVKAAGLADALSGEGPFTVFAPTDKAFARLGEDTIKSLLREENRGKLADILKYHVVAGRVFADQAAAAGSAATLQKGKVDLAIRGGRLRANEATVIDNDIEASNGVIHVIDRVLMPPAPERPRGAKLFGLRYERPSSALAAQLGIDRNKALLVTKVVGDSSAERSGLKRYDVITQVDHRDATDANVSRAKKDNDYDEDVEFEVLRRGETVTLTIPVGERRH